MKIFKLIPIILILVTFSLYAKEIEDTQFGITVKDLKIILGMNIKEVQIILPQYQSVEEQEGEFRDLPDQIKYDYDGFALVRFIDSEMISGIDIYNNTVIMNVDVLIGDDESVLIKQLGEPEYRIPGKQGDRKWTVYYYSIEVYDKTGFIYDTYQMEYIIENSEIVSAQYRLVPLH